MKNNNRHIIETQEVEITFMQKQESIGLQHKIAELVKEKLLPGLEQLFSEKTGDSRCIKIDSLAIELEINNSQKWEEEFVSLSLNKMRQKLDAINYFIADDEVYEISYKAGEPVLKGKTAVRNEIDALIYFLQHGILPWNFTGYKPAAILQALIEYASGDALPKNSIQQINEAIFSSAITFKRFITQFSPALLKSYVDVNYKSSSAMVPETGFEKLVLLKHWSVVSHLKLKYLFLFAHSMHEIDNEIFTQLFSESELEDLERIIGKSMMAGEEPAEQSTALGQFLHEHIKHIIVSKDIGPKDRPTKKEMQGTNVQKKSARDQTTYFIENAGLVILHPFLTGLFAQINYTATDSFINADLQRRAILLSQYLCNGETELPEYELLLNKILCGYEILNVIEYEFQVTEKEKGETESLLLSVIKHWSELKTTSIDGLRNSFLKRPGKLTELDDCWLLQVEHRSYDVLMNYLPWGIGIIKLPWMKGLLRVEWNA